MPKPITQQGPNTAASSPENRGVSGVSDVVDAPPPPRPSIPDWKVAWRFLADPFSLVAEARKECGDLFLLKLPGLGPVVFLCRAELLHDVHRRGEDEIVSGEVRARHLAAVTGDRVSVCLDGAEFKKRRRVIAPQLSRKSVEPYLQHIVEFTEELIADLRPGTEEELQPRFDLVTQKTMSSVLFGAQEPEQILHFSTLAHRYLEGLQWRTVQIPFLRKSLGPWSPWSRFLKRRQEFYDALEHEVRRLVDSRESATSDLMSALVAAEFYDSKEESIDAVVQELIGLVVGGAETTAKALSWCLRGLLSRPQAVARLRQELDTVLGDRAMTAEDLKNLPYLEAVVHEGLRHQSVGPLGAPRLTKKAIVLGGFRIPPETTIVQALHELGRGPDFPDPDIFDPDRFYGRDIKMREWLPFGGGSRKCTGMGLALVEMIVVIGTLIQRADLEPGSGSTEPVLAGIAHRPKNNMRVLFHGPRKAGPAVSQQSPGTPGHEGPS